jgi:AhpD family alkylhydroperoxidase
MYPEMARDLDERRRNLAPSTADAFQAFRRNVFADGALSAHAKQLIAVAVAHVTQCPYCIRAHTLAAERHGATGQEIMEAIWVAAEMRAGAAYAHSALAIDALARHQGTKAREHEIADDRSGVDASVHTGGPE